MKAIFWVPSAFGIAAIGAAGLLAAPGSPSAAAKAATVAPVVVELFQSQGCSSCPPANANLNAIADRADVIPLSFGVTYWDQLGWKDTFARRNSPRGSGIMRAAPAVWRWRRPRSSSMGGTRRWWATIGSSSRRRSVLPGTLAVPRSWLRATGSRSEQRVV